MTVPQVARRPNHDGVSPALDAAGDVEVLTAAPRLLLRPFSLPDDDDSEIRSPLFGRQTTTEQTKGGASWLKLLE
jgi:hypothetical protein